MSKKLLLYLLLVPVLLGEKKLFYNSEGVVLYDITSSKVEIIKKKKLELNKDVNLKEVLLKKDFMPISGIDTKFTIKYIEYDANKNIYNVYFELSFYDGRVLMTKSADKTLVMGIYDENFNYVDIKEYPTYKFDWGVETIEDLIVFRDKIIGVAIDINNDSKVSEFDYGNKGLYFVRYKGEIAKSNIKVKFQPVIMDKEKTFILGIEFQEDKEGETIYKYNLKSNKSETMKSVNNIVSLKTLTEDDKKLIYLTFNSFISIDESENIGKQVFVLDLKNMKTTEIKLSNDLFKEFYYSHEIQNTNKRLVEQFSELM